MAVRKKQDAARVLGDVVRENSFFCHDGCVAQNLYQLVDCLSHITEESFSHHVNEARNDFANWTRDVLGDDKLAGELTRASNRGEAVRAVKERIAWLEKKKK